MNSDQKSEHAWSDFIFNYDVISGRLKIAINCSTKHFTFFAVNDSTKKLNVCIEIFTIFSSPEMRPNFQQNFKLAKQLVKWPSYFWPRFCIVLHTQASARVDEISKTYLVDLLRFHDSFYECLCIERFYVHTYTAFHWHFPKYLLT